MFVAATDVRVRNNSDLKGNGNPMTLTRGQKIMCGIAVAVAMLLLASIRMTYFSDGTGSIKVHGKTLREKTTGNLPFHPTKTRTSGRR